MTLSPFAPAHPLLNKRLVPYFSIIYKWQSFYSFIIKCWYQNHFALTWKRRHEKKCNADLTSYHYIISFGYRCRPNSGMQVGSSDYRISLEDFVSFPRKSDLFELQVSLTICLFHLCVVAIKYSHYSLYFSMT